MSSSPTLKVLLLGDPFVGKTSLRAQYIHHVFSNSYRETVGADFLSRRQTVGDDGDSEVFLQIWDTAGQERFKSLVKNFYRGTDVAIFMYDVSRPSTFHNLITWINEFIENVHTSNPSIVVVGNKCDKPITDHLISIRQCKELLSEHYVDQYIDDLNHDIFYMSAKSFTETENLFKRVAALGLQNLQNNQNNTMMTFDRVDISEPRDGTDGRGRSLGCC